MYLQFLLSILFLASFAMIPTMSNDYEDVTNDFRDITTTMSTETMLCEKDLTFPCETERPDESTLSLLYPGFFRSASEEKTRKRRQSLESCIKTNESYATLKLIYDKDMCCIKSTQLNAPCVITDISRQTYEVIHLLDLGKYQFLPYTSCRNNNCSGECLLQFTRITVLVWNSSNRFPWVKFITVNLPTHCSCLNVGG